MALWQAFQSTKRRQNLKTILKGIVLANLIIEHLEETEEILAITKALNQWYGIEQFLKI